jgi:hypothetical protein
VKTVDVEEMDWFSVSLKKQKSSAQKNKHIMQHISELQLPSLLGKNDRSSFLRQEDQRIEE